MEWNLPDLYSFERTRKANKVGACFSHETNNFLVTPHLAGFSEPLHLTVILSFDSVDR